MTRRHRSTSPRKSTPLFNQSPKERSDHAIPTTPNVGWSQEEREDEGIQPATFFTITDFEKLDFEDGTFLFIACRDTNKSKEKLQELKPEFVKYQKGLGSKAWKSERDAKQHFINWSKKQSDTKIGQSKFQH